MEENTFMETYNVWTLQEDEWLWEQYRNNQYMTIADICYKLDRYPDDVIVYMCTHSVLKPEYVPGFGDPSHLALWKQQQEAFKSNPLFGLRKEIRQKEFEEKMYDMLRDLYFKKS
jgi:hypothetical protein